jgi:hypothetical protein
LKERAAEKIHGQSEDLADRQLVKELAVLERTPNAQSCAGIGRQVLDRLTVHGDLAARGREPSREAIEKRRLACPIRADHRRDRTLLELGGEIRESLDPSVTFR